MFIAARRIQAFWRAHRDRKLRDKRLQGCITIQRSWRGFRLRRQLWVLYEQRLQEAYLDHLNLMATRIQAFFRGWSARRNIHDMLRLTRIQTSATEDVVHCLIETLHHIKRTEYLPGVYSLMETQCMSKVENLIATMTFRFYNGRMTSMISAKKTRQEESRRHFRECRFQTQIPYIGHNFSLCPYRAYRTDSAVGNELLNPRMLDVAAEYEYFKRSVYLRNLHSLSVSREYSLFKSMAINTFRYTYHFLSEKRDECLSKIRDRERKASEKFCNSVITSMRQWVVWKEFSDGIRGTLGGPDKRERFFRRLGLVLEDFSINCQCVAHVFPVYQCP
ncbi:hypothetical protein KR200_002166, partial [Drosophila serrata]